MVGDLRAQNSNDINDGIAAGRAWSTFMDYFTDGGAVVIPFPRQAPARRVSYLVDRRKPLALVVGVGILLAVKLNERRRRRDAAKRRKVAVWRASLGSNHLLRTKMRKSQTT
jgi:hypothetical protein